MERLITEPRLDWERKVADSGFPAHTVDGVRYWDERVYYRLTPSDVDIIEKATNELHGNCLELVERVISEKLYGEMGIPQVLVPSIERSWNDLNGLGSPSIYGRMDLAFDGTGNPKLLEYNADTPTGLIEAAVVQWDWKEELFPQADQFNSIHERLIRGWKDLAPYLPGITHFTSLDTPEDILTVSYLQDTAAQAGLMTKFIDVEDIGWNGLGFVDLESSPMRNVFKLYPWEWIAKDKFGTNINGTDTNWIEPAWKIILSNKLLLPMLHRMFPDSRFILPAHVGKPNGLRDYVMKPVFGREGSNIRIFIDGQEVETGPDQGYTDDGYVFQKYAGTDAFGNFTPTIGSWLIQGESAGIGIRESDTRIVTNTSRFIPHIF